MLMNILSFELVLFISVLYLYMRIRKTTVISLKPVLGLTVYVPPKDEDFEVLEKTNKGGRENKKGEVNKYDKKKTPAKAKFPLRTIEINEELIKHNSEFFIEYDFFFMLFTVILAIFAITQTTKLVMPSLAESNLVFYMMAFLIFMAIVNLMKNTFTLGYFNYSDEVKIELLFAIKTFFVSFVCLNTLGSKTFFDFDIEKAHDESLARVNLFLSLMGGKVSLPYEFTYALFSVCASLMTFATVRLNIRFAYYFYVLTKNR
jgi:Predicted transmembrane protein 161AB